jgi:hypothetical protein
MRQIYCVETDAGFHGQSVDKKITKKFNMEVFTDVSVCDNLSELNPRQSSANVYEYLN